MSRKQAAGADFVIAESAWRVKVMTRHLDARRVG
jgi:hypothetical protein